MSYIALPIETDFEDVLNDAITYLQSKFANWKPNSGNLDTAMLMAWATEAAELKELASSVPVSIFRYFGATLVNLPPLDAAPATVNTTWTMINNNGYTVPAGAQVIITSAGEDFAFETLVDTVIPPGSTVAVIGVVAIEEGAAASGIGAPAGPVQLFDPLSFVLSITQVAATAGGQDAEDDTTYLNRLNEQLQLLSPRLILPHDFAADAKNVAGVWRALAFDGYNPADATFNNPRMIADAAIDTNGNPVGAGIKTAIQTRQQALREIGFIVNVIDAVQTQIDVTFTVVALPGVDHPDLEARTEAAVAAFLSPASWGIDQSSGGDAESRTWVDTPVVRYLDVAAVLRNTQGVDHITSLQIAVHLGALGTADVNLAGVAKLAKAGTIIGAVT